MGIPFLIRPMCKSTPQTADVKGKEGKSSPTPCEVGGLAKARTSWPGSEGGGGGTGPVADPNSSR
jgi:hypothetical protein